MKRKVFLPLVIVMGLLAAKCALAENSILFEDNFSTLDPGWGEANQNVSIKEGKLNVQPDINMSQTVLNQANVFQDMDANIKVRMAKSDDPTWGGGIVFWAKDYNDYYYCVATGAGQFTVRRLSNNRTLSPVDWR